MNKLKKLKILPLAFAAVLSSKGYSAGFEKAVQWSAKSAALGNAVTSSINGADALYFNPAGLSQGEDKQFSINISPTVSRFEGPITQSGEKRKSEQGIKTPFGLLSKYKVNNKWAVGAGVYMAAGTNAQYKKINFENLDARPDVQSSLTLIETGLGTSYKINNNFFLGATWRFSYIMADLASASKVQGQPYYNSTEIKGLTAKNYTGLRLGGQYLSDNKKWGLGVFWRSPVKFTAKTDDVTFKLIPTNSSGAGVTTSGVASLKNTLPQQLSVGGHGQLTDTLKLFLEYTWTEYSKNQEIAFNGHFGKNYKIPPIAQKWKNMHNYRVAVESTYIRDWALRGSYVLSSQVTDSNFARATFSSPGQGHTIGLGIGTKIFDQYELDLAAERSWASGKGQDNDTKISGRYASGSYTVHGSLKYNI